MPEISELVGFLCCGIVLLALLNLLLELLGISLLGGESKPGFLVRLIIIIALALGLGWGFDKYVVDMPAYQDMAEKYHGSKDAADCGEAEEAMFDDEAAVEEEVDVVIEAVEEEAEEVVEEMAEEAEEVVEEAVEEVIEEAVDEVTDEM